MTRRRKGERPVDRDLFYQPYGPGHPVENAIATGSRWFSAWQGQYLLTSDRLARRTGISVARQFELTNGAGVTRAEVAALAAAYGVEPADIIASLPDPALLHDGEGDSGR